jgi:hypothetical protein
MANKITRHRRSRVTISRRKNVKSRKVMRGGINTPRSPKSPRAQSIEYREIKFPDGTIYMGELLNGRFRHGKGILLWENGDRFEGYFDHNKRVGKGKEIFINQNDGTIEESYEGEFLNDARHGIGEHHCVNGVYKGEFKNGFPNGKGKFNWSDGRTYKGNVINNEPDYKDKNAVWTWPHGKTYHGALSDQYNEDDIDEFSSNETVYYDDSFQDDNYDDD